MRERGEEGGRDEGVRDRGEEGGRERDGRRHKKIYCPKETQVIYRMTHQ